MAENFTGDTMKKLVTESQILRTGAADCDTTAGQVDGQLASLRGYIQEVETFWQGSAGGQFQVLMTEFDRLGRELNQALHGISTTLRQNADMYDVTDSTNAGNVSSMMGELPPVRF